MRIIAVLSILFTQCDWHAAAVILIPQRANSGPTAPILTLGSANASITVGQTTAQVTASNWGPPAATSMTSYSDVNVTAQSESTVLLPAPDLIPMSESNTLSPTANAVTSSTNSISPSLHSPSSVGSSQGSSIAQTPTSQGSQSSQAREEGQTSATSQASASSQELTIDPCFTVTTCAMADQDQTISLSPSAMPTENPDLGATTIEYIIDSASETNIASGTLTSGAIVTVSGETISLASSGSSVLIASGGKTTSSAMSTPTQDLVIGSATIPYSINSLSEVVIASQTLTSGGVVTVAGETTFSTLPTSTAVFGIGSATIPYVVDSASEIVVQGHTLSSGGVVTVAGETLSLGPGGSGVVVASGNVTSTESLASPTAQYTGPFETGAGVTVVGWGPSTLLKISAALVAVCLI